MTDRFYSQHDTAQAELVYPEHEELQDPQSPPRPSMDSITESLVPSTTPLRGGTERRPNLMSRVATASLRERLSSHPPRNKRGSVYSVMDRPSSEMANRPAYNGFVPLSPDGQDFITHSPKSSVADSIVGSLRGISRRVGKAKPSHTDTKTTLSGAQADIVPLPSSPIDIPTAAPSLDLDLGPAGFMMPVFARSPNRKQKELSKDTKMLMDPANITSGLPPPTPILSLDDLSIPKHAISSIRPVTPRDLLQTKVDEPGTCLPPGPQTPMPGTSFTLDIDGAASEKSDKSHVFERSVTPSLDKERKELRKMRSLDAMAEACTIAHANDELSQMTELVSTNDADLPVVFSEGQSLRPRMPRGNNESSETTQTLHSCPSEMPELSRQCTPDNVRQVGMAVALPTSDDGGNSVYEDPFDDSNVIKTGPPSPKRSVELPFRPKFQDDIHTEPPSVDQEDVNSNNKLEEEHESPVHQYTSQILTEESQSEIQGHRSVTEPHADENANPFETLTSDDDTHVRAQPLCTSDVLLSNHDHTDSAAFGGISPQHVDPEMPQTCHLADSQQNISPRIMRYRSTFTAGLGDTEYKFSFDNWLNESSNAAPPESQPSTPHRRRMEMSLDSVSTNDEKRSPQVSPTAMANFEGTPTMGNRLNIDLKRCDRHARYSAAHQEGPSVLQSALQSTRRGPPRFILGVSDDTEATGINLANFDHAYAGTRETTPQKSEGALQARVGSEDSVADSLKTAAFNYSKLEERLADLPKSDDTDVFPDPSNDVDNDEIPSESQMVFNVPYAAPSASGAAPMVTSPSETIPGSISQQDMPLQPLQSTLWPTSPAKQGSPLPSNSQLPVEMLPSSTTESPATITGHSNKARVTSMDTLDRSLKLFMSSESGYQADESSFYHSESSATKTKPSRYRSKGRGGGGPLGEVSHNSC